MAFVEEEMRSSVSDEQKGRLVIGRTDLPRPRIIAAIPCYNEESFIGEVVRKARKYVDEVVVVDDGSEDGTSEAARAAGALVVKHVSNGGYGESIRSCFEAGRSSGADVLVTLDGDGQHDPDELPYVLSPILGGNADLVIGSRFLNGMTKVPRYRKFGIHVITLLFNMGSRTKVSDAQSGFRAYSKTVLDSIFLTEKGMGVSVEVLEETRKRSFAIKEVPISCEYHSESSTLNPVRHGLGVVLTVMRLRLKDGLNGNN